MKSAKGPLVAKESAALQLCWGGRFAGAHDVPWHCHAEIELVLVTVGKCVIETDEVRLAGESGALFVLPTGVAQYQHNEGVVRTTFIGLRAPRGLFNDSARVLSLSAHDPARTWLEQLCDWQLAQPPLGAQVVRQLLVTLIGRLQEIDAAQGTQAQRHPAVGRAIERIEGDFAASVTLEALAADAGVSASHLGALFAAQCGCSPIQYLQRRRLERAAWLLDNPYARISEVAGACGYEDVNYFVRLFRRQHGLPPGQWRKQRLKPPTGS